MDELEIDGKKYLSSRRAAKEHKYHIDYIGQLIRAGKVAGKKVGRSWYVEAVSLKSYLSQEAGTPAPAQTATVVAEPVPEPIAQPIADEVPVAYVAPEAPHYIVETPAPQPVEIKVAAPVAPTVPHISAMHDDEEERPVAFSTPTPERKQSTVRYIEEDAEPMLPSLNGRVRANADFVPVAVRRVTQPTASVEKEEEEEEQEQSVVIPQNFIPEKIKKNASFLPARMQLITIATVAVFVVAAAAGSAMLATSIKVSDGQAASVGITFK